MQGRAVRRTLLGVCAAVALLVIGVGGASAQQAFHGIAFTKGCDSPTSIGQPYNCSYQVLNVADTANDTLMVSGLSDQVHAFTGDVNSGNILGSLELVFNGAVVCVGGSGAGTAASPYIGATSCTLPHNASITTNGHSFYTVQAADFGLPASTLTDTATLNWNDLCDVGAPPPTGNCTTGAQTATAGSSSAVLQLPSSTTTFIHNAAHTVVTTVDSGTTVHDFVTVTGVPGQPVPTGNVNVDWFLNGDCSGNPAASSGSVGPLNGAGQFDATGFTFTVNGAGPRAFRANYLGDATYTGSQGACEPLQVVDANIQISPLQATNPVNTNHTLTGHVNVNSGTGFVNAPDGTVITFTKVSGPGNFVGPSSCMTSGGTGSCTVVISSSTTGTTVVNASTTVTVGGIPITRSTGDGLPGDSANANKTWVAAAISIAPSAANEVGTPHTFTVTVVQDTGTGSFVLAPNVPVTVTCTAANGAAASGPFNGTTNASGTVLVTVNSPTTGSLTCSASATLTLGNPPTTFTVTTDGVAPNSGPATKTWVDANIQITPANATNVVGTNHTLTGHVNVDSGNGAGPVNAPDGTVITFQILSGPGSFVGGVSQCTTTGGTGSCTVAITSTTAGTTVIRDSTTVSVLGVSLTRSSGDGHAGDSVDANKVWIAPDANIQISPLTATNAVGTNHTLTGHVNVNPTGAGFVNAPDGTVINFSFVSGPGTFVGPSSCTTSGGTGSCTVVITSNATGTSVVKAATDVTVNGVPIHRETGDGLPGDSVNAQKVWVDANIQITPATASNPVGTNHTLTGHVNVNPGAGFVNAPDGTVITFTKVSGPGSFVGPSSCTTAGGTGSCTVVITSATAGTTTVSASSTVSVGGVSLTRTTNGSAGNSGPAVKNWLDDVVTTAVRDASNADVTNTTVPSGTVVHDEATVAKAAGTPAAAPNPTGNVDFTLFNGTTCNGSVVATDPNKPLNAAGVATSATFTTPTAGGLFSYLAHYDGDANYPAHDGPCEPFQVNAVQGQGRITGGGSIFATVNGVPNVRVTHGFELRCDPNDKRQSLEINWDGGNNFHLSKLINSVVCFDDPLSSPPPPPGTVFDTYAGNTLFNGSTGVHGFGYAVGTGTCNKLPATIYFILIDNGEPGNTDIAEYHITGGCTLDAGPAFIQFGNHQFHRN